MGPTNALSKLSHSLALHFSPSSFSSRSTAPEGILWEPRPHTFGALSPRRHIAWSSGQRRDLGSATSVHRVGPLRGGTRPPASLARASLKTARTLERRSPGSWKQKGGRKSQADQRILVGARAALPSETRFPRSRRSPPDKPPGSCGRRGAPGDSPSPNSRPGSQAPGRASKHSRPGHHLRAPFVSSATHPLRDRCRSKVHTCPAHPDGRPCAHRRAPCQTWTHSSLVPNPGAREGLRAGRGAAEWAGRRKEEPRRSPLRGRAHCPAGRRPPGLPGYASDPGQGSLWDSWFLHPGPVGVTE